MNILLAASEIVPYAKTGGLADMVGMLAGALASQEKPADVILPLYQMVDRRKHKVKTTGIRIEVPIAGETVEGEIHTCPIPSRGGIQTGRAFFIEQEEYFGRPGLYGVDGVDYEDNCERFVFFCRAVLAAIEALELEVDILHCHDWQTALLPVYLRTLYAESERLQKVRTLLTLHNLAYQGVFWHWDWPLTGLDWTLFNWRGLEFYGKMNLLKGGIVFADAISTVSPSYSQEILTPEYGCGLEGSFAARRDDICGIVNGIDYDLWNPAADDALAASYKLDDLPGKARCKEALQRECGLERDPGVPLFGMVGRLTDQKGLDLLESCFDLLMDRPLQLVILGEGPSHYVDAFEKLCAPHEGRAFFRAGFDEPFSRRVFAGSDIFLMPSRFEPCGTTQLLAMRYGAVPLVRATGGLADTVVDYTPEGLKDGTATGLLFLEYNTAALLDEIDLALDYYQDAGLWRRLMENGMRQDWSYPACARRYLRLYERIGRRTGAGAEGAA